MFESEPVEPMPRLAEAMTLVTPEVKVGPARSHADHLFDSAKFCILQILQKPKKIAEITDELQLTQTQLKEWLQRLVNQGLTEKAKGSLYEVRKADLIDLFSPSDQSNLSAPKT